MNATEALFAVLDANWSGTHTVPATGLYPHQWSWDSAFIAIGARHVAPERARLELVTLLEAQWRDGRIPQIVYDTTRDDDYAPGDSFWRSLGMPAAGPRPSAGLVQPPNHAWAAWLVHIADPRGSADAGFLQNVYPRLVAWHRYLRNARASARAEGLALVRHPWESGTDNSPLWDEAMTRVPATPRTVIRRPDLLHAGEGERPGQREYRRFYWLAEEYRDRECSDAAATSFEMVCPLFNSLLAVSELALARIADLVGADPAPHKRAAADIGAALEQLWVDELGIYGALDERDGVLVRKATVNGLAPLLLGGTRSRILIDTALGPRFLGTSRYLPSYDHTARDFDAAQYWRGPAWYSTAWLVYRAAQSVGSEGTELAARIRPMFDTPVDSGVCTEYIDPDTGDSHGTRGFSWTAALALDVTVADSLPALRVAT